MKAISYYRLYATGENSVFWEQHNLSAVNKKNELSDSCLNCYFYTKKFLRFYMHVNILRTGLFNCSIV